MEPKKLESIVIDSQTLQQRQDDECQKLESRVIDLQTLQQLQGDINKELSELLNNSKLSNVFDEYGISGQNILKVQCSLDLTQFQGRDTGMGHQVVEFSSEILELKQKTIEISQPVFCNPCIRSNGQIDPNYPRGCWINKLNPNILLSNDTGELQQENEF